MAFCSVSVAAGWLAAVSRAVGSSGAGGATAILCVSGVSSIGMPTSDGAGAADSVMPCGSLNEVVGAGGERSHAPSSAAAATTVAVASVLRVAFMSILPSFRD